jgi:hypothetical protein
VLRHEVEVVFDQPRRLMQDDHECSRVEPGVLSRDVVLLTRRMKNDLPSSKAAVCARSDQAYRRPTRTGRPDEVRRSS